MDNVGKKYVFSFLGGDSRQAIIAGELRNKGHDVKLFGLEEYISYCPDGQHCMSMEKALEDSEILILPLPVSRDNEHLSIANSEKIPLKYIIKLCIKNEINIIFGGMLPEAFINNCKINGIDAFDYYKVEELQQKNALPSAEGALMLAMEHSEITVHNMNALVSGYGRIGSRLAAMLLALGANVTVAARRDETICEAVLSGYNAIKINSAKGEDWLNGYTFDVIFNTVPEKIFNSGVLRKLQNKPLYIEIASNPGGIECSAARDIGIKIISAPSLPGRYSPITAGKYIFETISSLCIERGIAI